MLLSVATGIAFGLMPALEASKMGPGEALKSGGKSGGPSAGGKRFRCALVVAEVALTLILSIGAGLLIRSFVALEKVNPGFDARNVLSFELTLPEAKYNTDSRIIALYRDALIKLRAVPGAQSVGIVSPLPMSGGEEATAFTVEDHPVRSPNEFRITDYTMVSSGYFAAMGIPIHYGREIEDRDDVDAPPSVVVSETFARAMWPGINEADVVGKRMRLGGPSMASRFPWMTVVGVVGDVKRFELSAKPYPEIYVSYLQKPYPSLQTMQVAVRTSMPLDSAIIDIRSAIHSAIPTSLLQM